MIQLIVFDAVGTLLHPAEPVATTYVRIFNEFGIRADEQILKDQFRTSFVKHFEPIKLLDDDRANSFARDMMDHPAVQLDQGNLSQEQLELVELVKRVSSPTDETHQKQCWQNLVFDCIDRFSIETSKVDRSAIFQRLWRHFARPEAWRVESQLIEWVKTCSRYRISWVIASNFDSRLSRVVAGHSEFDTCAKIYDSASLGFQKPDPRFYRAISADFQMPPERTLMIGDNVIGDFLGPKIFGWQARWFESHVTLSLESLLHQFDR